MNPPDQRIAVLDALRGIAALGVCWFHFTHGNTGFLSPGFLKSTGSFGWLGVEMFFVISGFIIPFSMHRSEYSLRSFGKFMLRRIVRLDPPYFAAILIVIMLGYASTLVPGFRGQPFNLSFTQLALHVGYVNALFGYPWLNPVFWTLAIEFQYYLAVGLAFPAIAHRSFFVRIASFAAMACLALLVPAGQFLFKWLFLFMLGMAAFQLRVGMLDRRLFGILVLTLGLGACYVDGLPVAAVGAVTSLVIGLVQLSPPQWLLFFGNISYSLYLLHVPVGGRVVNLGQRFADGIWAKLAVLGLAMGVSVAAAWLLYRFVERPAQQWCGRIRYAPN